MNRDHTVSASPWVCLMFHDVLPETSASGGGAERFAMPLAAFERTLDTILQANYVGCSLATALTQRGRRRVAITFDDGTRGQFAHAVPALRARGMTATFFVTTSWVGQPGFMLWDELTQLVEWGMSVQSHTHTHPFLSELDAIRLRRDLSESKAMLDRELGQETRQIALPGGDAPARALRSLLWETGYRVVAGSQWGVNQDAPPTGTGRPLHVRRCTVRGNVSPRYAERLIGGDPWLGWARRVREVALAGIRSAVRPSRYAQWRRRMLDALARGSA